MKKINMLVMLLVLATSMNMAQPIPGQNYRNQAKYWFYRNRLINEFVKIGPAAGESLPFESVNRLSFTAPNKKFASMGDGGIQKAGHYIGVLATEIKLLKNSGQSTTKTINELFFALNAIKRLDQTAETYWGCYDIWAVNNEYNNDYPLYNMVTCQGDQTPGAATNPAYLNGFMIRDDHSTKSDARILKHFNNMSGIDFIATDFIENERPGYTKDKWGETRTGLVKPSLNEVSHDQFGNLLLGLRLVQVCLDGTEYYSGVNLKDFAKAITINVLSYMENGMPINEAACKYLLNYWDYNADSDFGDIVNILAPQAYTNLSGLTCSPLGPFVNANNDVPWLFPSTLTNHPASMENEVGASFPFMLSRGYAHLGTKMTGSLYYSSDLAGKVWKLISTGSVIQPWKQNDNWKILSLVALSNSWDYPCMGTPCILPCAFKIGNKCIKLPAPGPICGLAGQCKNSKQILCEQSYKAHYEILPLLNNVIHGTTGFTSYNYESFYQSHIDAAPCTGPYSFTSLGLNAPGDWASWNLWFSSNKGNNHKWAGIPLGTGNFEREEGEYNGLDYMLMYNLYNLYQNKMDYYKNYDNNLTITTRVISSPEFFNARSHKDYHDPDNGHIGGTIIAGELTADHIVVVNTGYADLRAGSSITLNPPFTVNGTMSANIYQPANNWDWEMTTCSGGTPPNNGIPIGHKEGQIQAEKIMQPEKESVNELGNSYPNPASDVVVIPYSLGEKATLEIYLSDALGKKIATLVSKENQEQGKFMVEYSTASLPSGVYYYTMKTKNTIKTKKMTVVK